MKIIEIAPGLDDSHSVQNYSYDITPMDGWAVIPEDMAIPASFPFVDVEAVDGVVTALIPREVPPPEPAPAPQTDLDLMAAAYQEGVQGA